MIPTYLRELQGSFLLPLAVNSNFPPSIVVLSLNVVLDIAILSRISFPAHIIRPLEHFRGIGTASLVLLYPYIIIFTFLFPFHNITMTFVILWNETSVDFHAIYSLMAFLLTIIKRTFQNECNVLYICVMLLRQIAVQLAVGLHRQTQTQQRSRMVRI